MKPATAGTAMGTEQHIIIVDDSDEVRETAKDILVAAGYSVDTACCTRDALRLLSEREVDLFLLDVKMPGGDGLTLLRELKIFENIYEAIMMTGYESVDDAAAAMESGAFSYIRKPVKRAELLDHVKKALALVDVKKERYEHLRMLEERIRSRSEELDKACCRLQRQERRIDAVINSMDEGLLAIDNNELVVLMNGVAEKITGVRFGSCAGVPFSRCDIRPEVKRYLLSRLAETSAGHGTEVLTVPASTGIDKRYYSVTIKAVIGETGELTGHLVLFADRTDAMNMEILKESFLSVAAHELRTPLTIMMNYLCLLRKKSDDREMLSVALEDMLSANRRMKHLVDSIINFITLSAQDVQVRESAVDVGTIIREGINKLENETREKNITFEVIMSLASARFFSDPDLVTIAVDNILNNAVKFNRESGRVRIFVKSKALNGETGISIEVSDEGEGLSPQVVNNLFESFRQGEDHLTRSHSGLGTGLFLAQRAVKLLGGVIRAESLQGGLSPQNRGSRFTLELPCSRNVFAKREITADIC